MVMGSKADRNPDKNWTIPDPRAVVRYMIGAAAEGSRRVLTAVSGGGTVRTRNYAAATISRLTAGWTTSPKSADTLVQGELRTLRARSREQVARNDYARRYVHLLQSNVVGSTGIALESQIQFPDGTADSDARKGVESAWKRWGMDSPEVTERMSWTEVERLLLRTAATDGEILVRYREGRSAGPWAFQIQVLDPELLDVELNEELSNGHAIRQGVEVDEWGAPQFYHLLQSKHGAPADYYSIQLGRGYVRIPADEILHAFVPEWVGQRRGLPWLSTSLERLKMLGAYEEAALTHARTGASQLGFFKREAGATGFTGDEEGSGDGDSILNLEPGEWNTLPAGVSVETYDPKYPSGEFAPFTRAILKGISAGLGPAYTTLAQDLEGTSYAGGRMGLLEERELYRYLQTWLAATLHRPLFLRWLRWALLMGQVTHPKSNFPFPSSRFEKFSAHAWRGRRWPWVDPQKDANAAETMLRANLTSESRIIRELGQDPTEVWDEIEQDQKEKAKRGITTNTATEPSGETPSSTTPPNPDAPLVAPDGSEEDSDD